MNGFVLVTGTSRGIGKATVEELRTKGIRVISITRSDSLSIDTNEDHVSVGFNWEKFDEMAIALKEVIGKGAIVGIVNNAGMLNNVELADERKESFLEHMRVNVWNQLELFRSLYNVSLLSTQCTIVNIGSMGGVQGASKFPGLFSYSASKSALAALTEALEVEYGGQGLSFNYLALGAVNTEMLREAFPGYFSEVDPENMAKFIVSFMLSSGGIMSGKIIPVAKSDPEG